jgi:competence protein ComEC
MQWMSAPNIAGAPLPQRARGYWKAHFGAAREGVEAVLERERAHLPPWFVVGFGTGIAAWFALNTPTQWLALLAMAAGVAVAGFTIRGGRTERAAAWFALAIMLGCALVWGRSAWVAAPRLERPLVIAFDARVERVEGLVARGDVRLTLAPVGSELPPRVRVTVKEDGAPKRVSEGALVRLRARLAPPPPMALPGGYDFARDAWFRRIGGVGRALGPVCWRRAGPAASTPSATGWASMPASSCQAVRAESRRHWPTATRMPSPPTTPRRCGGAA